MVSQRAPFRSHRRTKERDDACSYASGHMHHAGIARDQHGRSLQTRAGFLEGELARHIDDARLERRGELAIASRRSTDGHDAEPELSQPVGEGPPMLNGPPFGGVRRPWGNHGKWL